MLFQSVFTRGLRIPKNIGKKSLRNGNAEQQRAKHKRKERPFHWYSQKHLIPFVSYPFFLLTATVTYHPLLVMTSMLKLQLSYPVDRPTTVAQAKDWIHKTHAAKTGNCLQELLMDSNDPQVKEEVEIFSLQLLHRKVEFDACGFFKVNFGLLNSMMGAVTTYIVILIQFQTSAPSLSTSTNTSEIN